MEIQVSGSSFVVRLVVGLMELESPDLDATGAERAIAAFFYCRQLALALSDECGIDISTQCLHQGVHILLQLLPDDQPFTLLPILLRSVFSRFCANQERVSGWSLYFAGCALVLNLTVNDKAVSTGMEFLKKALESDDPFVRYEASIALGDISTGSQVKLHYFKLHLDAAIDTGSKTLHFYALCQIGDSLAYLGDYVQARHAERKLQEILHAEDKDPLLKGLSTRLAASIAFGEQDFEQAIRLNKLCVEHLERVPDTGVYSWASFYKARARGILKDGVSPGRIEWKTKCRQDALNHMVRSHCHLLQIKEAKETAAKLGDLVHQVFQGVPSNEMLRLLSCQLYVNQHECVKCQVESKRSSDSSGISMFEKQKIILEESEPLVAEMIKLSDQVGDGGHYVEAINFALFIADLYYRQENGLIKFSLDEEQDMSHLQLMKSLSGEAVRLAKLQGHGLLGTLASAGFFSFRENNMEDTVDNLRTFAARYIEGYYNFGDQSEGRISYHENWKEPFRTLQVAYLKLPEPRPDHALVWAERERARDLNLLLDMTRLSLSDHQRHAIRSFDLDDEMALAEIVADVPQGVVFLVFSLFIANRGICSYLLHSGGLKGHYLDLGMPAPLEDLAEETLDQIIGNSGGESFNLQVWYRLLITPLEEALEAIKPKQLVIIPSEELSRLPFAAMHSNDDDLFLIEKYAISYAPSLRLYKHCCAMDSQRERWNSGLVMGNPKGSLLPRAGQEAAYVKHVLTGRFKVNVDLLLGENATKDAFLHALPVSDWVHFAGHACVSDNFPRGVLMFSSPTDELAGNGERGADEERERFLVKAPSSSKLTGDEIVRLFGTGKMQASAVILSACSSGCGRICSEGVLGLTRSFHVAGAQCVMSSLWTANDEATEFLMRELYTNLSRGNMELAFALQASMVSMIRAEEEGRGFGYRVKHWAPFFISGSPHVKL